MLFLITRTAHVVISFAPTHQRQPHRFWRCCPHQSCVESQCKVPPNISYCMPTKSGYFCESVFSSTDIVPSFTPRRHCVCIRNAWSAGKLRTFYFSFENDWWALLASVYSCLDVLVPACLPAYLSVSVCAPVCLPSICLSVCLSVCLPVCLSVCLYVCLSCLLALSTR